MRKPNSILNGFYGVFTSERAKKIIIRKNKAREREALKISKRAERNNLRNSKKKEKIARMAERFLMPIFTNVVSPALFKAFYEEQTSCAFNARTIALLFSKREYSNFTYYGFLYYGTDSVGWGWRDLRPSSNWRKQYEFSCFEEVVNSLKEKYKKIFSRYEKEDVFYEAWLIAAQKCIMKYAKKSGLTVSYKHLNDEWEFLIPNEE